MSNNDCYYLKHPNIYYSYGIDGSVEHGSYVCKVDVGPGVYFVSYRNLSTDGLWVNGELNSDNYGYAVICRPANSTEATGTFFSSIFCYNTNVSFRLYNYTGTTRTYVSRYVRIIAVKIA